MSSAPSIARGRLRALGVGASIALTLLSAIAIDARARAASGGRVREHTASIARVTGLSELALSTSSVWLRHPALAPPSAGTADAPIGLDVDPGGAAIAPPSPHVRISIVRREP